MNQLIKSTLTLVALLISSAGLQAEESHQPRALITSAQKATLSAPMSERLLSITVEESDSFKRGEPLITFECDTLHAEERQVAAELEIKRRTHKTHILMQEMQSISGLEVAISAARIKQAAAALQKVRSEVERCTIEAPFDGRVTVRHVEPYESVKKGEKLIEIVANHNLRVELHIPSHWLRWLTIGTPFELQVDETGTTVGATVSMIGAHINPVSQTLKIRGTLSQDNPALLHGMSGTAHFKGPAL